MSQYRLELWFNFDGTTSCGWGLANVTDTSNPSVVEKRKGTKVKIPDGNTSQMDIVVFDASTAPASGSNSFDYIQLDFEITPGKGKSNQTNNPITDGPSLRNGLTSAQFDTSGPTAGMSIYSYPGGTKVSLNGWENTGAFESLSVGNYTFSGTMKATPAGGAQQTFPIDPEIEIDSDG
jgi:hypothetical protein